jgi:hypothetical protein
VPGFRVPDVTSGKFILATVLLDAFLHGQGQIRNDAPGIAMAAVGRRLDVGGAVQASMSIRVDAQSFDKPAWAAGTSSENTAGS